MKNTTAISIEYTNVIDEYFNTAATKQLLEQNQLLRFEQIWALETEWFEAPNQRRNGWSGVIKQPLIDHNGNTIWVFIKRQENHNFKTLLHPLKGIPTFQREYFNIKHLTDNNIPTLTTLYYNERVENGKDQAILITRSLEGYQSFQSFFAPENPEIPQRTAIMELAGQIIRKLHDAHFRHNCLYAKHLFVNDDPDNIDIRLIDLEKLKWLPLLRQIRRNDLSRLIRRGNPMTYEDLQIILNSYYKAGKNLENNAVATELNTLLDTQERYL